MIRDDCRITKRQIPALICISQECVDLRGQHYATDEETEGAVRGWLRK